MSSLYETPIGGVITLYFLVLKCFHQFSCSSHQKQGSPSTILVSKRLMWFLASLYVEKFIQIDFDVKDICMSLGKALLIWWYICWYQTTSWWQFLTLWYVNICVTLWRHRSGVSQTMTSPISWKPKANKRRADAEAAKFVWSQFFGKICNVSTLIYGWMIQI